MAHSIPPHSSRLRNATPYEDSCSSESSTRVLCEVQALSDFVAIEDKDLSFKDREILVVMETKYGGVYYYNYSIIIVLFICSLLSVPIFEFLDFMQL